MQILITGENGLLGSELMRLAKADGLDVIGTDKEDLDVSSKEQVANFFKSHNPEIIINCAAVSPKECEKDPQLAFAVNVQGVENLFFNKKKSKLIQFSSPAIFDNLSPLENIQYKDDAGYGYKEVDIADAKSVYGKTKIAMEKILDKTDSLILRISWIYTKSRPFGLADTTQFPVNEIGRPTYIEDIWKFLLLGIKEDLTGIYHVCGPEVMSRHEQARLSGKNIEAVCLKQDNIRPLSISKIQPLLKKYKIELTKWHKAVKM